MSNVDKIIEQIAENNTLTGYQKRKAIEGLRRIERTGEASFNAEFYALDDLFSWNHTDEQWGFWYKIHVALLSDKWKANNEK